MIAVLASQMSKKRRILKHKRTEKKNNYDENKVIHSSIFLFILFKN